MNQYSITVAIPVFNGGKYITEALDSIINQSLLPDEIIIADDNSTDNTLDIVAEWHTRNEFIKLRIINNPTNIGYGKNLDVCLDSCKTKFIQFLHQDDILTNQCLEHNLNAFKDNPGLALVGGREKHVNERKESLSDNKKSFSDIEFRRGQVCEFIVKMSHYIPVSSVMLDVDKAKNVGHFVVENLSYDELFWVKTVQKYPIKILGKINILRRMHGENLEYEWFFKKEKEFVKTCLFLIKRLPDFEISKEKKKIIRAHEKKRTAKLFIAIASLIVKKYKNHFISFKYLTNSILVDIRSLTFKSFWKTIIINTLIFTGLYNHLKRNNT